MTIRGISLNQSIIGVCTSLPRSLFAPVDAGSLVFFRIAFGSIMLWEVWRYFDRGWISHFYIGKQFYFKYWPFDFVQPWPGDGMLIHFGIMAVFASCIALGFFYRVSATAFFLMFTYVFLLEKAQYLNHYYLICLISFLMIFVPAHRHFSLDALLRPSLRSNVVPAWSVWLIRFQIAIPMFFGGIAKLNADWLRGEPLRAWLADRTDFPLVGRYFTDEPVVWLMVYSALLLDLFFVAYILNRRTRVFGFLLTVTFHIMNHSLFGIGIFPWLMIAATLIYFPPGWPRRVLYDLRHGHSYPSPAFLGGFCIGFAIASLLPGGFSPAHALVLAIALGVAAYHLDEPFGPREAGASETSSGRLGGAKTGIHWRPIAVLAFPGFSPAQTVAIVLLGFWVAFQVLLPLRHFPIPGKVHWTEEGHKFSWHMLLRDKNSEGFFVVTNSATGEEWQINPRVYLSSRQVSKMTTHPQMVVEFARFLKDRMWEEGKGDVEVRANISSSLNGRDAQLLIDPEVDLTQVSYPWFGHAGWIYPLRNPLRSSNARLAD